MVSEGLSSIQSLGCLMWQASLIRSAAARRMTHFEMAKFHWHFNQRVQNIEEIIKKKHSSFGHGRPQAGGSNCFLQLNALFRLEGALASSPAAGDPSNIILVRVQGLWRRTRLVLKIFGTPYTLKTHLPISIEDSISNMTCNRRWVPVSTSTCLLRVENTDVIIPHPFYT